MYRNQCEELRSTLSKRQQDQVCAERLEQLKMRDQQRLDKMEEDRMYAHLWEQDRLKKAGREEAEAKSAHERNLDVLNTLRVQMSALEQKKEDSIRLKEEEAQLLVRKIYLQMPGNINFQIGFS